MPRLRAHHSPEDEALSEMIDAAEEAGDWPQLAALELPLWAAAALAGTVLWRRAAA